VVDEGRHRLPDAVGPAAEGDERLVADAAVYLASDGASFVNGVALPVDNTLTARLI
jgi:NAD(P)-dependent dehydrogenase (short-subunit alcohol dehydrogenase family)